MKLYEIPTDLQRISLQHPERGMGYQEVTASFGEFSQAQGILICSRYFFPVELAKLDSTEISSDERRVYVDLNPPNVIPFQSTGMVKQDIYVGSPTKQMLSTTAPPSAYQPPFLVVTTAGEVFYRLSPFKNDNRITRDGGLAPQTYSTTDNDFKEVPSGLAAVGRYALPSRLPAVHVFLIQPPAGTVVAYGTVTPNFHMAGGGVEALFPKGCAPGTVKYFKEIPMK